MIKRIAKTVIKIFDDRLGTNLYEKAVKINNVFYNSAFLRRIQSAICFAAVRWKYRIGIEDKNPLRLHLGCGNRHLEGYINIDCRKTAATDLVCNIRKLPYRDNSTEMIECYHVLEHVPVCLMANIDSRWGEKYSSLTALLKEWKRVLKSSGKLIIEVPDFDKMVEEYVNADEDRREELLVYIYGGYRFNSIHDLHRWGVNMDRLKYILEKANFRNITFKEAQDYHKEFCPCLRVEVIK